MKLREERCAAPRRGRAWRTLRCAVRTVALSGIAFGNLAHAQAVATNAQVASADPAAQTTRARLTQHLSGLPKIDGISATGMPGLYEVRLGIDVFYTDAQGNYLIRIGERVQDASGTLVRNIARPYDALNRLQSHAGPAR